MDISDDLPIDSMIREISQEEYKGWNNTWDKQHPYNPNDVVVVRELTFGCLGEPASKVSLWFDLPEPTALSNHEIKRLKRNRQRKLLANACHDIMFKPSPFPGARSSAGENRSFNSSFETHAHKPFFHMRPTSNDPVAFHLIQSILKHRISVLLLRKYSHVNDRVNTKESHLEQEARLQVLFTNIKKDIKRWKWPVPEERAKVCAETLVPPCSTMYNPSKETVAGCIWEGFLKSKTSLSGSQPAQVEKGHSRSRLSVFRTLSQGRSVNGSMDNILPHIRSEANKELSKPNDAWLMALGQDESDNGWNLIKEHYLGANETNHKDKSLPLSPPHG